jgi:hypothetical protein
MFVFDPMSQGLELLGQRELQQAENLFLQVINDPYSRNEELKLARTYLNDIRACQTGVQSLDFDRYKHLARKTDISLDIIYNCLVKLYFSPIPSYKEFDQAIADEIPNIVSRLKQIKIRDI